MNLRLFTALGILAATPASAAIVLVDSSFESNNITNGGATAAGVNNVSGGWTSTTGTNTTYLVDNGLSANTYFNTNAAGGGQQALSLANGSISQQLNDNATPVLAGAEAQQFDISFYVGARKGATQALTGTFSIILQAFNGNTYTGTDLAIQRYCLGTDALSTTIDLGLSTGDWSSSPITLSLIAPANLQPGMNIRLAFAQSPGYGTGAWNTSGEAGIDNISITAVPEPSVTLLGGLGALALLRRRRA